MTKHKSGKLQVSLVRSPIATLKAHKACVKGLGLRKLHHTVVLDDTASIRGMINKVRYLVSHKEI